MKNRYRRTFVEKYGIASIISKEDCQEMINKLVLEYRKANTNLSEDEWIFNKLPYLGILYCSLNTDLWYDTNIIYPDLIRVKVISVEENWCTVVTIDDHNKGIAILRRLNNKYLIEGNFCKTIEEFN